MGKYHLPDGETLVEELQCLVVYTPKDPVYRQALWGAISQLTKYWMWEPDGAGGEHDAADSWDLAYAQTLESFGMLEELLQSVDEVEPLLRQMLQQERCCDQLPGAGDIIAETEADGATSTTDVDGGVFPDGITTESEWDTYICAAATALIDRLIEAPSYITQFASFTISTITAIVLWYTAGAYIAIAGAIGGVLTLLDLFDLIDVFENLVNAISGGTEDEPGEVETKLLAIRDELICDIVLANDADAATSAVNNRIGGTSISTVWKNLFLLFFTNQYIMATVFNGEADQAPTSNCTGCAYDIDVLFTFDADEENWSLGSRTSWDTTEQALELHPKSGTSPDPVNVNGHRNTTLAAKAGVSDAAWDCGVLSMDVYEDPSNPAWQNSRYLEVWLLYQDGTSELLGTIDADGSYTFAGVPGKEINDQGGGGHCINLKAHSGGSSVNGVIFIDNIRFAGHVT